LCANGVNDFECKHTDVSNATYSGHTSSHFIRFHKKLTLKVLLSQQRDRGKQFVHLYFQGMHMLHCINLPPILWLFSPLLKHIKKTHKKKIDRKKRAYASLHAKIDMLKFHIFFVRYSWMLLLDMVGWRAWRLFIIYFGHVLNPPRIRVQMH